MATVFLWKPYLWVYRQKRAGHISLRLSDGTYISFWPSTSNIKSKLDAFLGVQSSAKTYEDDVKLEGGEPDETIEIPAEYIDEAEIKNFWKDKMKANYSFLVQNCATVVKEALKTGCSFSISVLYAADPRYVFSQINHGLQCVTPSDT